jgi:hypothetical protein
MEFIGVQYVSKLAVCQAKSESLLKSIDKIQTVGVQFFYETIGHQDQ